MSEPPIPSRERQALAEVGHTEVGPATARVATLLFLLAIAAVPVAQLVANGRNPERRAFDPLPELESGLREAVRLAPSEGLLAANRRLLAAIDRFESELEEQSLLRSAILPWGQWLLTRWGAGNEQAYLGRDGWLFYRPDVDHVTGPGFLEPRVLTARARGGEAWEARPEPDPMPALAAFARDLEARGIELLVVPVPGKPSIHPEKLSHRAATAGAPVRNPSWGEFLRRLDEAAIEVVDIGPLLFRVGKEDSAAFLATDTHWTAAAMERVAQEVAAPLELLLESVDRVPTAPPLRREAAVEGPGDIANMLRLPPGGRLYPAQRIVVHPVLDAAGRLWRPQRGAPVLLLGDSFTNVYSDPTLGWGSGAGLAEQLAFALGRPIDRIAQNAGGAYTARQQLARELTADPRRLDGVEIVVYQFAERELSLGDWKLIDLPAE